jgi:DNA-binding Lrp family transcriptional regulator
VLSVFVAAGSDDFLIHVAVRDIDHLHAFLTDRLAVGKEVVGFRSSIIFRHLRKSTVEELPMTPPAGNPREDATSP